MKKFLIILCVVFCSNTVFAQCPEWATKEDGSCIIVIDTSESNGVLWWEENQTAREFSNLDKKGISMEWSQKIYQDYKRVVKKQRFPAFEISSVYEISLFEYDDAIHEIPENIRGILSHILYIRTSDGHFQVLMGVKNGQKVVTVTKIPRNIALTMKIIGTRLLQL